MKQTYTFEIHNQLESFQENTKNNILLWFLLDQLIIYFHLWALSFLIYLLCAYLFALLCCKQILYEK